MKRIYLILFLSVLIIGCQPPPDNSANEAFVKNTKSVMTYLEGFQNESVDYSAFFAEDYRQLGTGYGAKDTLSLDEVMESNKGLWAAYDLELNPNAAFLPGVNGDTKLADGSVRYYGTWKVTRSATDSTEAKSGELKGYGSFDFSEDGKIIYSQFYGDVTGLLTYLNSTE